MRKQPYKGPLSKATTAQLRDLESWYYTKIEKSPMYKIGGLVLLRKMVTWELDKRGRRKVK